MDLYQEAKLARTGAAIKTPRLELRQPRREDAAAVSREMGRYEVARWLIAKPYPLTENDALDLIGQVAGTQFWLAWDGDKLVGGVSVVNGLGFWVARENWGRGYAGELAAAGARAYFEHSIEDRLLAGAMVGNVASHRILLNVGFARLGDDRVWSESLRQDVDVSIYAMRRPNPSDS